MSSDKIYNINILSEIVLPTPREVKKKLPITELAEKAVLKGRAAICDILDHKDPRVFVVVGPCSIHDIKGAKEYASRLFELQQKVKETFVLVMRVYFEKPRTSIGWKGLINDPYLDNTFHIEEGLQIARKLLIDIAELGLPSATEALDPISPQYLNDLISWTAIGARTTESQTHREMSSGLSTPVGFKNGTDGNIKVALNALESVSSQHHFLGINIDGQCAVMKTKGNRYAHIVLRGGHKPNYDSLEIKNCETKLSEARLSSNIMVDCSHGNSYKDHTLQSQVFVNCVDQILKGNKSIVGFMIESNLSAGRQDIPSDVSQLKYGVSVTDACIDWATTEEIILAAHERLKEILPKRWL